MNDRCQDNNNHLGDRAREDREIAGSHRPTPVAPFGCGRPMVVLRPRARFTASRVELHSNLRNPGRLANLGPRFSAYCTVLASPSSLPVRTSGRTRTSVSSSHHWHLLEKQGYGVVLRIEFVATPSVASVGGLGA